MLLPQKKRLLLFLESPLGSLIRSSIPEIVTDGTPAAGKQAVLSLVITNDADQPRPFVELVEVRDSNGVTVFAAWQSGILDLNSQKEIGVS